MWTQRRDPVLRPYVLLGLLGLPYRAVHGLALTPYQSYTLRPTAEVSPSPLHNAHLCQFLTSDEAEWCVKEAEDHAIASGGWFTDRHGQFPTTDFALMQCRTLQKFLQPKLQDEVVLNPS